MRRSLIVGLGGLSAAFIVLGHPSPAHAQSITTSAAPAAPTPSGYDTVVAGDTLGAIAASHGLGTVDLARINDLPDANHIEVGEALRLSSSVPAEALHPRTSSYARAAASTRTATVAGTSARPADDNPVAPAQVTAQTPIGARQYAEAEGGFFADCVRQHESNNEPRITNASGHYGLYQFSYGTWVAYGGVGADFGRASAAEQDIVFGNAIAAGGQSAWAGDGC